MSFSCRRCGVVDAFASASYRGVHCPRCGDPLELARAADEALSFACPWCRAEVDASAPRCGACGRWFGRPRCEACRAPVEPSAPTCDACGALLWTSVRAVPLAVPCPVCDTDLRDARLGGATLLECPGCRGMLVGADVVARWTEERGARAPVELPPDVGADSFSTQVRYRRCPRCAAVMNRVNFGAGSGVIVDVCKEHGTWFDAGELARVVAFARSGRLEAALRRKARERDEERARLSAQMHLPPPGPWGRESPWGEGRDSVALFAALGAFLRKILGGE